MRRAESHSRGTGHRQWLLGLLGLLLAAGAWAEDVVNLGFYQAARAEMSRTDVRTSFDLWAQELGARFQVRIKVHYFEDPILLHEAFLREEINGVNADGTTLARHFNTEELAEGFSVAMPGGFNLQLLVAKDGAITGIKDLAGKRIALTEGDGAAELYLESLCLHQFGRDCSLIFAEVQRVPNNHQAIMRVFFGKADAVMSYRYSMELAKEMNPQLARKVGRVIAEMPISSVYYAFFSAKVDKDFRQRSLRMIPTLHTYLRGRQLLDLFKMDHLELAEPSELKPFIQLEKDVREMKARGNHKEARR
jgi:ABC-type phosphate/phosphonate transport system substrate-binding protein